MKTSKIRLRTINERAKFYRQVAEESRDWCKMSKEELLKEVQKFFPIVVDGDSAEHMRSLFLDRMEQMIGS